MSIFRAINRMLHGFRQDSTKDWENSKILQLEQELEAERYRIDDLLDAVQDLVDCVERHPVPEAEGALAYLRPKLWARTHATLCRADPNLVIQIRRHLKDGLSPLEIRQWFQERRTSNTRCRLIYDAARHIADESQSGKAQFYCTECGTEVYSSEVVLRQSLKLADNQRLCLSCYLREEK